MKWVVIILAQLQIKISLHIRMKEIPDVISLDTNPINSGVITIHGGPKPN